MAEKLKLKKREYSLDCVKNSEFGKNKSGFRGSSMWVYANNITGYKIKRIFNTKKHFLEKKIMSCQEIFHFL